MITYFYLHPTKHEHEGIILPKSFCHRQTSWSLGLSADLKHKNMIQTLKDSLVMFGEEQFDNGKNDPNEFDKEPDGFPDSAPQ